MDLVNTIYFPHENPPLKIAVVVGVALVYVFRRFGSFNLSGNLLSFCAFLVLFDSVLSTGGLYSDNLLWMMGVPLLSLLFATPRFGMIWLVVLLGFTTHLYVLEINAEVSYRTATIALDEHYFFTTYIGLFIMIVGIVLLFAYGQQMIISTLDAQKAELSRQKDEISKQAQSLKAAEQKLLASNIELEQFAYTASHDLKEPLRMISSYTQLIQRKLNQHLDASTTEYMGFITGGVSRMDKLLSDLLEYSRLGHNKEGFRNVNLNEILFIVINNLVTRMQETNAVIFSNELPVVKASHTEMIRLFQNLIANSIKFRREDAKPVIYLLHEIKDGCHQILVQDNGIGIPEENAHTVFNIFERLHGKHVYEGTGIGLATCRKIVHMVGGEIAVIPTANPGTAFLIKLPLKNAVEPARQLAVSS